MTRERVQAPWGPPTHMLSTCGRPDPQIPNGPSPVTRGRTPAVECPPRSHKGEALCRLSSCWDVASPTGRQGQPSPTYTRAHMENTGRVHAGRVHAGRLLDSGLMSPRRGALECTRMGFSPGMLGGASAWWGLRRSGAPWGPTPRCPKRKAGSVPDHSRVRASRPSSVPSYHTQKRNRQIKPTGTQESVQAGHCPCS